MSGNTIVIDSSDDEQPPRKKIKITFNRSTVDKNVKQELRISNIQSLASVPDKTESKPKPPEVVVIDDDEEDEDILTISREKLKNNGVSVICTNSTTKQTPNIISIEDSPIRKVTEISNKENLKIIPLPFHTESVNNTTKNPTIDDQNNEIVQSNSTELLLKTDTDTTVTEASTTSQSNNEMIKEFEDFLNLCCESKCNIKYIATMKNKMDSMKQKYLSANTEFIQSKYFLKLLKDCTEKVNRKPENAIICYREVYRELGARKEKNVELTDRQQNHLRALNKMLGKLHKKIKRLEEKEVNWDEDNDSDYIQVQRYRTRFCAVYKKICSYTKEDEYASRSIYRSLDFNTSKFPEINRSIEKLYNKKKEVPSYYQVDKCIKDCVKRHQLNLVGETLEIETKAIFTALGNLLQRRRKQELHDTMNDFVDTSVDPATEDPELESRLQEQYKAGENKIEAVLQKYTDRGKEGEEPAVSSDSDDSNWKSDSE